MIVLAIVRRRITLRIFMHLSIRMDIIKEIEAKSDFLYIFAYYIHIL